MAGIGPARPSVVGMLLRVYMPLALASVLFAWLWRGFGLPVSTPQTFPVYFYQHVIGELDGRSCPSYPVCSVYARQAVGEYGLLLGSWLALDRLIHEADDVRRGPWLVYEGERRLNDSLQRNTSWLREKQ